MHLKETERHNCNVFEKSCEKPLNPNKGTAQKEHLQ